MRALCFHGVGQPLQLTDVPDPEPGPGEVVIKVARCGICGTDLHRTEDNVWTLRQGTVPGHEFAGEVVALGKGVEGLKTGARITALPYIGCGHCASCLSGSPHFCPTMLNAGSDELPGAYAEYVKVGAASCVPLPVDLSLDDGALVEPLAVGLHAVRRGRVGPSDRVLILGAGPIGLAAAWWARRTGARRVVVAATSTRRRDMALAMGADAFLVADDDATLIALSQEALQGRPDVVMECVGLPGAIARSLSCVAAHGRVVVAGACSTLDQFMPLIGLAREAEIIFSTVYVTDEFRLCVEAMDAGDVAPRMMITDRVSLEQAPTAFEELRGRSAQCKVLIDPWA